MKYAEIAGYVYSRNGLIGLIPEGRKATPLLPGILEEEVADCMITYVENEGETAELFHVIRVSGERIGVTDCKGEKITIQPRYIQHRSASERDKTILQYTEMYAHVRDKIAENMLTDEDREMFTEFLGLFEALCGISVNSIKKWFSEYTKALNNV